MPPNESTSMLDRMEADRQRDLMEADKDRLSERERSLHRYREMVEEQERAIESYRAKLKDEQISKEKQLQEEFERRESLFAEREKKLLDRQREFEHQLMRRQAEVESLRLHLHEEVGSREAKLQQALLELQQEKERYNEESRTRIERTSKNYVVDALKILDEKEKQFHFISKIWSAVGAVSLLLGLAFFIYVTISSALSMPPAITWEFIVFAIIKGLIAITILIALARYAFVFSNSYMREALKNADRRHAINFGKFYLESYGAAADWSQVKEAFEHWNITGSNAFTPVESTQFDVSAIEKAASLIERVGKSLPSIKSGKDA
jgi:hypothetical protein